MSGQGATAADPLDLVIIGGGIMGLFTAYHAAQRFTAVTVLERGRIGDPATASYGLTRSFRRDYLDAGYARLADEAMTLWADFEADTGTEVLVRCGCMNIAKRSITPDLDATYAQLSCDVLERIGIPLERLATADIAERFPYLDADLAYLDDEAGVVDLGAVTRALRTALDELGVVVVENLAVSSIDPGADSVVTVTTDGTSFTSRSLVITAGHGTNELLALLPDCPLQIPLTKDRPSEAKYFVPPPELRDRLSAVEMPVIAYLDTGIYLHPIVDNVIEAVKIGYYNPPDMPRGRTGVEDITSFVEQCMPGLLSSDVTDVTVVDQCDYDLVDDDDFVIGEVPWAANVFVGVGWRGTGYKFAPWVGRVLAELALQDGTVYDIARFEPARFLDEEDEANR